MRAVIVEGQSYTAWRSEEQHQPLYMTGSVLRPGWKQDCY